MGGSSVNVQTVVTWVRSRDRGLAALRRAARTAIVMPALFALGDKVFVNADLATFAAFGSFAMLLLVDFSGPMRERLQNQAVLAVVGAVFVAVGTLASRVTWMAVVAMALVGFAVIFAGVVSSVLAGATTSLLLAFILPVSLPGTVSSIPDRLAGWGLASVCAIAAVGLLWPAPTQDPLRSPAAAAIRATAVRVRADVDFVLSARDDFTGVARDPFTGVARDPFTGVARDGAAAGASAAVGELRRVFLATPYRPTGLSTSARAIVRLVDEVMWLDAILDRSSVSADAAGRGACAVKEASARALDRGADLLVEARTASTRAAATGALSEAMTELRAALDRAEQDATEHLPVQHGAEDSATKVLTSLDPSFRAQEISFAVSQIAANIELAAAAEDRTWWARVTGHQPAGSTSAWSAAQERAVAHVERHSVWLHNSLRGATGLGLAVLIADLSAVQHSFWVVLGALSVLRSSALNTGQNAVRGLLGTLVGFVLGAALLAVIGTNTAVLWVLLAPAILIAGFAPAAISFAAGQAAFTLTLVILFNIIQPAGWQVGLLRVEDIALGCAVSLVVGVLFWPRGAGAALGRALAEAYADTAGYLGEAVAFGMDRCDGGVPRRSAPTEAAVRAAAASRRLDDTFRTYLAERGSKPVPLAEVSSLVTGVVGLRLAGDAVLDLWQRDDGTASGDRSAARRELLATTAGVGRWYAELADSLTGRGDVPDPLRPDPAADTRLIDAVRRDLRDEDGRASATAVRIIWTGDHVDAARRLQATLVTPAHAAHERALAHPLTDLRLSRGLRPVPAR